VSIKPDEQTAERLKERLKSGAWEGRMLAMTALSMLSKKAATAIPEMMAMLAEFGDDAGRYSRIFDCMAMINPEIAVAGIIKGLKDPDAEIRRNAVEKLVELQAYLASKLPVKKEIVPALIRALYSGDKIMSELAEEGLAKIEDADARAALGAYLKMGRMALNMLYKLAGTTAEEVFKKQEEGIDIKINEYYRSIGREDAIR
jgi:HEAT repeat protein